MNPFGGCLPQLVQMPVWFAMYTTLQTAVEMYHEKFLWIQDLAAPAYAATKQARKGDHHADH